MKATGIVRCIDDLGRIILPKEIRQALGLQGGDPMEIFAERDRIILRRHMAALDRLRSLAQVLCDIAAGYDGSQSVLITDRYQVVAGAGDEAAGRIGGPVDEHLLAFLSQNRKPAAVGTNVLRRLPGPSTLESAAASPIVTGDGEVVGAVIVVPALEAAGMDQTVRAAELIARYLSRQLGVER